jgi:hypothetical protein
MVGLMMGDGLWIFQYVLETNYPIEKSRIFLNGLSANIKNKGKKV